MIDFSSDDRPVRATIDSRDVGPGDLFVGLTGQNVDGGTFAAQALAAGAWGVLVAPEHADGLDGRVLVAEDPLRALQDLATAWRRELGAQVIGITGSTGKTSTKDILRGMLRPHRRTVATPQNLNTEIGLPLTVLAAARDTEVLVLEMGMRGEGQIAELARIAEPDVGVIVSIGPVHLELLGTVGRVAAAKAELLAGLPDGGTAVVPHAEPLLEGLIPKHVSVVTFGEGGDVASLEGIELPFDAAHLRRNAMAALAAARAVGVEPSGPIEVELWTAAASGSSSPAGSSSWTTATTPTRCRCALPSTSWPAPRVGAWPSSATCSNSAPMRSPTTPRSATTPASAPTCWSPSGRWPSTWPATAAPPTRRRRRGSSAS